MNLLFRKSRSCWWPSSLLSGRNLLRIQSCQPVEKFHSRSRRRPPPASYFGRSFVDSKLGSGCLFFYFISEIAWAYGGNGEVWIGYVGLLGFGVGGGDLGNIGLDGVCWLTVRLSHPYQFLGCFLGCLGFFESKLFVQWIWYHEMVLRKNT